MTPALRVPGGAAGAMRILGIDPGSLATGYGVIEVSAGRMHCLCSGVVRPAGEAFAERLHAIFDELREIIGDHRPEVLAIEQVFMHRNAASALKLGHARGVAICAAATSGLAVHEYSPRSVKQSVVGVGGADKVQVQHMVRVLLGLEGELQEDAADALAVAVCHSHSSGTPGRIPGRRRARGGRWR